MEDANEWRVQYNQIAGLINSFYMLIGSRVSGFLVLIVLVRGHCLPFTFNDILPISHAMVANFFFLHPR